MAYTIQLEKSAAKQLSKLEKEIQIKIAAKIDELADDPRRTVIKSWLMKAEPVELRSAATVFFTIFSTKF